MAAAGQLHFLLFNRLYPWDHAPGWLLHREAGGYSAAFDGTPYRPSRFDGGLIVRTRQGELGGVARGVAGRGLGVLLGGLAFSAGLSVSCCDAG